MQDKNHDGSITHAEFIKGLKDNPWVATLLGDILNIQQDLQIVLWQNGLKHNRNWISDMKILPMSKLHFDPLERPLIRRYIHLHTSMSFRQTFQIRSGKKTAREKSTSSSSVRWTRMAARQSSKKVRQLYFIIESCRSLIRFTHTHTLALKSSIEKAGSLFGR